MLPPEFPPADDEPPRDDELTVRRSRRFARREEPRRFGCPTCGAHADFGGLCLVCCADLTRLMDEHGQLLPPA